MPQLLISGPRSVLFIHLLALRRFVVHRMAIVGPALRAAKGLPAGAADRKVGSLLAADGADGLLAESRVALELQEERIDGDSLDGRWIDRLPAWSRTAT